MNKKIYSTLFIITLLTGVHSFASSSSILPLDSRASESENRGVEKLVCHAANVAGTPVAERLVPHLDLEIQRQLFTQDGHFRSDGTLVASASFAEGLSIVGEMKISGKSPMDWTHAPNQPSLSSYSAHGENDAHVKVSQVDGWTVDLRLPAVRNVTPGTEYKPAIYQLIIHLNQQSDRSFHAFVSIMQNNRNLPLSDFPVTCTYIVADRVR